MAVAGYEIPGTSGTELLINQNSEGVVTKVSPEIAAVRFAGFARDVHVPRSHLSKFTEADGGKAE